mmetsp:Transcript_63925/g.162017  ORF Transcript_63925/g.162017 Transcript_63925/m.162017 type:complete len:87 (+) Transcript_63925:368-628(+)
MTMVLCSSSFGLEFEIYGCPTSQTSSSECKMRLGSQRLAKQSGMLIIGVIGGLSGSLRTEREQSHGKALIFHRRIFHRSGYLKMKS